MKGRYVHLGEPVMIEAWKIKVRGSDKVVGYLHYNWKPEEARVLWLMIPVTAEGPSRGSGQRRVDFTQIASDTLEISDDVPLDQLPHFLGKEAAASGD